MSVYREGEDRLGAEEREEEATRMLGRWRSRVLTTVLVVFAVGGLVPGAFGYWITQEAQFRYNSGIAFVRINVVGGAALWFASMLLGQWLGRRLVAARTAAEVARLAAAYEIPGERLAETARLLRGL